MPADLVDADRPERSIADVQRNFRDLHPSRHKLSEESLGEMKTCCGCGDGAFFSRVNSLVAFAICYRRPGGTLDIWGQRRLADLVQEILQTFRARESHDSYFVVHGRYYFTPQVRGAESYAGAHPQPTGRPGQHLPDSRLDFAQQKKFDPAAGGLSSPGQARGKDPRIVNHEGIAFFKARREFGKV